MKHKEPTGKSLQGLKRSTKKLDRKTSGLKNIDWNSPIAKKHFRGFGNRFATENAAALAELEKEREQLAKKKRGRNWSKYSPEGKRASKMWGEMSGEFKRKIDSE